MLLAPSVNVFLEDLFMPFRFVSKQHKTSNAVGMSSFDILISSKGASALGMFKYISKI